MTLPLRLASLPSTASGRHLTSPPMPPALFLLALCSPPAPPHLSPPSRHPSSAAPNDPSTPWLRNAAAGLAVLAAAAAAVSFTAQYRMVNATRHFPAIAAAEAAIPDTAALVFACLGIALALHGRRALRARTLNLASVTASVAMNALAAAPGWRDTAIWTLPPITYALASDTLITVIRARHHVTSGPVTPARLLLWLARLALAPASTLAGFRAWVLAQCPVTPPPGQASGPVPRKATKTRRFLDLVNERHGPLSHLPLHEVAAISAALAPAADLHPGSARAALRKAVLAARTGDPR